MELTFEHESDQFHTSDACNLHSITITIIPNEDDEAYAEIDAIFDEDAQVSRKITDFNESEQASINKQAQDLADKNAHNAYYEAEMARGEAMYDAMKEGY